MEGAMWKIYNRIKYEQIYCREKKKQERDMPAKL